MNFILTAPLTICIPFFLDFWKKMMTLWIDKLSFEQPYFIGYKPNRNRQNVGNV